MAQDLSALISLRFIFYFYFKFILCAWEFLPDCIGIYPWEPEWQTAVSCLVGVGNELRSSREAASDLNTWAISPAPLFSIQVWILKFLPLRVVEIKLE